jgi:hypothetical protein
VKHRRARGSLRAWYAGKAPPSEELIELIAELDPEPEVLYDSAAPAEGPYAETVKGLYDKMAVLKRNPSDFRPWSPEDGLETFLKTLFDQSPAEIRTRVRILQQLGDFHFRVNDGPQEKKAKIEAVFAEAATDDPRNAFAGQAHRLKAIWTPKEETLLASIIEKPALVGRSLSDRLNPTHGAPLRWIGHPFATTRSTQLHPLAQAKVVAFEAEAEIHLISAIEPVLARWDEDESGTGVSQITLLDTLLLHELVEVVLNEDEPNLQPLAAHIVASTFERYLKGELLQVAAEDYFLSWPPFSLEEQKERQDQELADQVEASRAFFEDEEVPDFIEDDTDDLPLDQSMSLPKKKKAAGTSTVKTKAKAKKKIRKKRPE